MITRLWPLTLLVTQIVLGYDHKIDLERCNKDTACFIRESCLKTGTNVDTMLEVYTNGALKVEKECSVILQMKPLTLGKLHVIIQVKLSGNDKFNLDHGLKLFQQEDQFVCKKDKISVSPKFTFNSTAKPIYDDQLVLCSFIAELTGKAELESTFKQITSAPKLIFKLSDDTLHEVEYALPGEDLWKYAINVRFCDRSSVKSTNKDHPTDKSILLTEVDTIVDNLKCSAGVQKFFVLTKSAKDFIEATEVYCHRPHKKWRYTAGGTMTPIDEEFEVYCSEKVCRKCDAPPTPLNCDNCKTIELPPPPSPFLPSDVNKCPILKCPLNKWTVDGKSIIDGPAECRRSKENTTKFAWLVKNTELKEAACMEKVTIDCGARFKDGNNRYPTVPNECLTNPVDKTKCQLQGMESNSMTCASGYKLKLHAMAVDEKDEFAGNNTIECNTTTGLFFDPNNTNHKFQEVSCVDPNAAGAAAKAGFWAENQIPIYIIAGSAFLIALVALGGCIAWRRQKKDKGKKGKTEADTKQSSEKKTSETKSKSSNASASSGTASAMSAAPGGVDGSEGKKKSSKRSKRGSKSRSKKSKKEDKFKLEDYETWDNEAFTKKILPNFNTASVESRSKWLRNHMCRFYAYCNTKKTPESGTFNQFWLLVKKCMDDKCEDAIVWTLLWRSAFTMAFSVIEKTSASDEFRLLVIKPFEAYMVDYLKKCDLFKRKDESRSETEMRVICIEILLHTRHPDVTEELRKLTFNEKLEVPLRMLTAACLTRERDEAKASNVVLQFTRVSNSSVLDPHINEGWGTYLQHCIYGLGAYNITEKEVYQDLFFDAMYQVDKTKDDKAERRFSPTDWLFAFKGALLHENSAKIALEKFKKLNDHCLLHIEVLLKKNHEDPTDLHKTREMYKLDMKEYTLMLADLLVGEEEYNDFKPHLRFVAIYVGEHAKTGEPLDEERIRERAINMGNMVRDRNFFKESCDSLKAIGAKNV